MNEEHHGLTPEFGAGDLRNAKLDHGPPAVPRHEPHAAEHKEQPPTEDPTTTGVEDETVRRAEALDPDVRRSLELGPPAFMAPMPAAIVAQPVASTAQTTTEPRAHATLEEMLPTLVRKIAWGGNGQRGSVRMELGAGKLAGGTVVVHADDGKVRVEVSAPSGADPAEWRRRIDARLRESGLDVESVEVS